MIKKINTLFFALICFCGCIGVSFAAQHRKGVDNLDKWEYAYWKLCGQFSVEGDNPCIGASVGNCNAKSLLNPSYGDEYGILMMVAKQTTIGGAEFCPVMIIGANRNWQNSFTEYYDAGGDCVWLCREGFSGERCTESASASLTTCDNTKLLQSNYSAIKAVGPNTRPNIEDDISNWGANNYVGNRCAGSWDIYGSEHDVVMAISNWLPSGHGAKVRPYIVLAAHDKANDMVSWINIYPAAARDDGTGVSTELLGCKDGYKPNANKTDCEPINKDVCETTGWSAGWNASNSRGLDKVIKIVNGGLQWRCINPEYGLDKAGGSNCYSCGSKPQNGVSPSDGTCVHCKEGTIFAEWAANTDYCTDSYKTLDKTMLVYGPGGKVAALEEQCWTITDTTEYKKCVFGEKHYTQLQFKKKVFDKNVLKESSTSTVIQSSSQRKDISVLENSGLRK